MTNSTPPMVHAELEFWSVAFATWGAVFGAIGGWVLGRRLTRGGQP